MILNIESPEQLADFLAPNLNVDVAQKQAMLEELDVEKRVRAVQKQISAQLEIAEIQQRLQKDVASQFSDAQRRAYLRSQIKAIQRELGEAEGGSEEQARAIACPARGSESARRSDETGRARIEAARFHSAGQPGVFSDRQLHRDHRRFAVE